MNLRLYNTLTRKKEVFKPLKDKKVNLFVCGPTAYDFSHLGHARTYIIFDMLTKFLRQSEYDVFYLQNITDIDDKIIKRAKEENVSCKDLSQKFEKEYLKDMETLKVNSITKYARATEHIKEIIAQVKKLLEKGYAYQIKDGVYYDISKFEDYGKLSKRTALQAEDAVSRIDEAKEKRNKGDFCLWKFSKLDEPKWKSPFGDGRPGWHIEDTAITEKYFGPQYDIHGGARDLIFPHHEAEISQMEAISDKKPLVRYWLHTGFLTVQGQKMAKRLGNFITIQDFLKKYPARILRFLVAKTHYRSPIDYNEKMLSQTKKELERIDEFISKLNSLKKSRDDRESKWPLFFRKFTTEKDFQEAMDDDFNTPKAMAAIFELVNIGNTLIAQNRISMTDGKKILELLKKIDKIFNFIFWQKPKGKIPHEIKNLAEAREKYRRQGNWQKADEIRQGVKEKGYLIEDTEEGPKIKAFDKA